jgi:hypothetical protein
VLRLAGSWRRDEARLRIPRFTVAAEGVSGTGSIELSGVGSDPEVALEFTIERVEMARLLRASGVVAPEVLERTPGALEPGSLGAASLEARVTGRLSEPASFKVAQKLEFEPPARPIPAVARLRGEFQHVAQGAGGDHTLTVGPSSPDFIALGEVPPLFVRALLLAEDAGFYGHRGLDLGEVTAALLHNWETKGRPRGASTLTQQLAKNLFLSRERRLGRKLQELSLALLLEAQLSKERILEIYLNVIEWGPGLYGLRPAAHRYFAKGPADLAPAEMALLVALIPGPIKYQRSLAQGVPSPGFRPLVDLVLAKLRSVDAITEDEYQAALADELRIAPPP